MRTTVSIAATAAMAMVLGLLAGCRELAMPPAGSYSEVLLVTEYGEEDPWFEAAAPLITREYDYVISQESGFELFSTRAADLEDFPTYKNIVICGPLDTSTEVGRRIQGLIGPQKTHEVLQGKAAILKKENLPSPGQVTLILTAADGQELQDVLDARGDEIRDILEASCRERLRRGLLTNPNEELMTDLQRRFGFYVGIPSGLYKLFSDDGRPPGVELLRQPPARVLGVYWVDREQPPTIYDRDELFDIRSNYVWKRYDHDKMDRDKVDYRYMKLGEYDSVRMAGYWYNDDAVAGGYFETYFVHDPDNELLWAVDLVVYAPGRPKHPLVRELEALAETFRYD
jgi:hypothetical protein